VNYSLVMLQLRGRCFCIMYTVRVVLLQTLLRTD